MKRKSTLIAIVCVFFALSFVLSSCTSSEEKSEPPAKAAEGSQTTSGAGTTGPNTGESVSLIGDSVPLGAVPQIEEALPGVEMLVRTDRNLAGPGLELLEKENDEGKLGDIVVLALGTSNLTEKDIENAIAIIGENRQIVFVTAYRGGAAYIGKVNEAIHKVAAAHTGNFTVADWYGYVEAHPDLVLAEDHCHLTEFSAPAYAEIIKTGVEEARGKANA